MTTPEFDPMHYNSRMRQIKTHMHAVLTQWGLVPKFIRWRLAQDPLTKMVVLFGILDNKFIASQTATPFSNYFDPRLLHDLEKELHLPIITSENDGLRYAFVLDPGDPENNPSASALVPGHPVQYADEPAAASNTPQEPGGSQAANTAQINQKLADSENRMDDRDLRETGPAGPPTTQRPDWEK